VVRSVLAFVLGLLSACADPGSPAPSASAAALTESARVGPSRGELLRVARGERIGFSVQASDGEADLQGAEWYLDGRFLGAQYRSSLPGSRGESALFWRGINFPELGAHLVEVQAFDRAGHYGAATRWSVEVQRRPRVLYVDRTYERLASAGQRSALVAFVARHGFDEVVLYELHRVLPEPEQVSALRVLLAELRLAGVSRAFAAVGSVADVERVGSYLEAAPDAASRLDGLVTEYEFWHGGAERWRGYLALLAQGRVLADAEQLVLATYVGWFDAWQAGAIAGLSDIVFLHAYVPEPGRAYGYIDERLRLLARSWSAPALVYPIFSAERTETGGSAPFMGDWLRAHRADDPLEAAEAAVQQAFRDDPGEHRNGVRLGGFAWYAADHLEQALR
jgi:hypothetical protein